MSTLKESDPAPISMDDVKKGCGRRSTAYE